MGVDVDRLGELVKTFNKNLGAYQRIVARRSGTENKLRIMAEGENEDEAQKILASFENEILNEVVCAKD